MIIKRGDQWCLVSKTTNKTLGCHGNRKSAEAQEAAIKARGNMKARFTVEQMREICPSCADKMKARNINALKLDFSDEDSLIYQLSEEALAGLCAKFGDPDGFRTQCIESNLADGVEDAGAFCNWLKGQCHGESHGESHGEMASVAQEATKTYATTKPLASQDIKNVEIFAIGEWNDRSFSSKDLDTIVDSFNKTNGRLKPYVKLGHDKDQKLLDNDGLPAAGWVESLRRVGDKLVADLKRVPQKIKQLIEAGAFRRVSVELIEKYRMDDHVYDLALSGLALLGAKTPAVDTLDDIMALYGTDYVTAGRYNADAEAKAYIFDREAQAQTVEDKMSEQEIKALRDELASANNKLEEAVTKLSKAEANLKAFKENDIAELQVQYAASEAKVKALDGSLVSEKTRADQAEDQVKTFQDAARKLVIEARVDGLIREKKLAPAQKEFTVALLERGMAPGEHKFSIGDKEFKTPEELLYAFISAGSGVAMNDGGQTAAGEAIRDDVKDGIAGEQLHKKALKYVEEHKVSYREAYMVIAREDAQKRA